jgi:hypothetical protein
MQGHHRPGQHHPPRRAAGPGCPLRAGTADRRSRACHHRRASRDTRIWAMTAHRVHRLTAATPDSSGYQKARADAAARAARGQTYPDQRPMGGPGVIRRCLAAPAGLHPGKSQRVDVSYFGACGHLPLGVAPLRAVVLGILLAVIGWFGRGVRIRAAIAGVAGPGAKRGSAHSQKQSAAQTPCAQAGLQGQEARRAGRLSMSKGSGIRYAATPVAAMDAPVARINTEGSACGILRRVFPRW